MTKVAVGPNAHGNEVYERMMIDPQGNLVSVPWNAKVKEGWTEATPEDVATAAKAADERVEQERKAAEQAYKDRKDQAVAAANAGGPLLTRTTDQPGRNPLAAKAISESTLSRQDARLVDDTSKSSTRGSSSK